MSSGGPAFAADITDGGQVDPKAPTPAVTDNDTSLATTAFVRSLMARYGLGAASTENVITNIDSVGETGVYMVTGTTTGAKPTYPAGLGTGAIANGTLLHMERWSSNMATQIWDSLVNTNMPISFIRTRNTAGVWSEWGQLWTSLNTPKQASLVDPTPGAMLTPGSFGLGGSAINFAGNIDAISASGLYMISAGTLGTRPVANGVTVTAGSILHIERGSSSAATQIWDSLIGAGSTTLCFIRTKTASGWTDWTELVTGNSLPFRATVYYKTAGVYSWTVPAGVTKVFVEVRGGGGSGSFGWDGSSTTGPGGGGGISKRLCTVTPGSVITVTVGAGGAYVSVEGAGNAGGTSSFGSFCSATGGAGGSGNAGAVSGVGVGGDFNAGLGMGSAPVRNSMGTANWGGAGGGGESTAAAMDTSTLTQPGMGGGGRTKSRSQAGADGCVFITY